LGDVLWFEEGNPSREETGGGGTCLRQQAIRGRKHPLATQQQEKERKLT
jgi:hypothetical protein